MKISVIIPVYNRAKKVLKAAESVLSQTHSPFEVLIIDNCSDDNPELELQKLDNKRVKIFKQEIKGVAAARNLGIKESKTDWLAFLDSDDWWLPTKLEEQVDFHKKNSNCLISQTDEIWIRNGHRVNPKKYHMKPEGDIFELSLSRCLITPSSVLINKKVLDEVGLFDESLPVCEDYDLWLRISCNYPVGLIKEKLVVKTGGHDDQLSAKYWGMDRFRVKSLKNLLDGGTLSKIQEDTARLKLEEKLRILENGAKKRGKELQIPIA